MTTGTSLEGSQSARQWATEHLGVPENASIADARQAYFRKLRECDFVAPRSWKRALQVLDGTLTSAEPDEEWLAEEEARLRGEIDLFAQNFFGLPKAERRERWGALFSKSRNMPALVARLEALKPGLDLETQSLPVDESHRGRLAEHLLHSFPLLPLARAASRQAFLREIEESLAPVNHKAWEKAARYLLAEWPDLATLDRDMVQHLARLRHRLKQRHKLRLRSQRTKPVVVAESGKSNAWWLLLLVGGAIARAISNSGSHDSSQTRPPKQSYNYSSSGSAARDDEATMGHPLIPDNLPPMEELLDASKFDIEMVNPGGARVFRFTFRPGSTTRGFISSNAGVPRPVWLGEAGLRLLGVSKTQIDTLVSRVGSKKAPRGALPFQTDLVGPLPSKPGETPSDGTPRTQPMPVEPRLPQSSGKSSDSGPKPPPNPAGPRLPKS